MKVYFGRAMTSTYRIAEISLGNATIDCSYEFSYRDKTFEVQRFGANFSIGYLKDLIVNLRNSVDAFAISDLPGIMRIQDRSYVHRQYLEVMSTPSSVPFCDGSQLKELSVVNALSRLVESGEIQPDKGVFFPLSLFHLESLDFLQENYRHYLGIGDSYSVFGIPWLAKPGAMTTSIAQMLLHLVSLRDLRSQTPRAQSIVKQMTKTALLAQAQRYHYVFSDSAPLTLFGDDLHFIHGKEVIVTYSHFLDKEVKKFGPKSIISLFPKSLQFHPYISYPVLDATLRLAEGKTAPLSITEWQDLLSITPEFGQRTKRRVLGSRPSRQYRMTSLFEKAKSRVIKTPPPDFAFIVHPLSKHHLLKAPGVRWLKEMPNSWLDGFEKMAAKAPGFVYGHIKHIVSKKTNREVNGVIYGIMSTPKMMMSEDPEVIYRRIESLCDHAGDLGAKIMGLGAYTKVIGDSGETISRNSPIPVTTGNSLSASATLWAVYDVVGRMKILDYVPGTKRYDGTATVIGATGSIGKVSAKLLSLAFKKVCLVAPRMDRLLDLQEEIRKISPECEIVVSTNSNDFASESDVLVTATSSLDQKVVEVDLLKPGCVVCDCSRPLDFTAEDSAKRPDILIIESGEVILPGPVKMTCDLGLPDDSVYACLGETALLALEERYEPFTLGRNIDWQKVRQIYKMAQAHGVKLAAIRGHTGFISDREIELTKQLALSRRHKA